MPGLGIEKHPAREIRPLGRIDGLPASVRDQANRNQIPIEKAKLEQQIATDTAALQNDPKDASAAWDRDDQQNRLKDLEAVQRQLTKTPDAKLMVFDMNSGRHGHAALAFGDPDTANHVSVTTPGLNTTVRDSLGDMSDEAQALKRQAERDLRKAGRSDESVASISWIGYDAPLKDGNEIGNVAAEGRAQEGAKALASFYNGVDVASAQNQPHITALGHSYGSLTTSLALQQDHGRGVQDVVFYGSPGLGDSNAAMRALDVTHIPTGGINDAVQSPASLGMNPGHVYEMTDRGDLIANLNAFGRSPNEIPWITHLGTGQITVDGKTYTEGTGHAEYGRSESNPSSPGYHNLHRSGYNLAAIVAGLPDYATNPPS
ncbi:hypothetical protein GZH49_35740 [Nocardia terpenica]|uniref:alpha/beta hydrolase n=1 Tax=Nocardia terpenica TaxID=455432 RepID=UPI002FE0D27D